MADLDRLHSDISKFLDVYRILSPESRAAFEAQMDKIIDKVDLQTETLYRTLHQAAKDGLTSEEAIAKMKSSVAPGNT
jgi:hypothetical protein